MFLLKNQAYLIINVYTVLSATWIPAVYSFKISMSVNYCPINKMQMKQKLKTVIKKVHRSINA